MLTIIRNLLEQKLNDIDAGNSNISEQEELNIINLLQRINNETLNKLEAAEYIGVSRATFDNYVDKGIIPKGIKERGETLHWNKKDLDNYLKKKNERL